MVDICGTRLGLWFLDDEVVGSIVAVPIFRYTEILDETKRAWIMSMPLKKFPVRVPKQGTKIYPLIHKVKMARFVAEFLGLVKLGELESPEEGGT